jgi:RimJ/RimL family protein N-acetyltransferase
MALPETDELIGVVGLVVRAQDNAAEVGYWLGVPYWNQGYTTEAVRAVIDFAFETMGLNRIAASYLVRNPASGRVMEKAGMLAEGVHCQALRKWGVYEDLGYRAILRSEWEARRPP